MKNLTKEKQNIFIITMFVLCIGIFTISNDSLSAKSKVHNTTREEHPTDSSILLKSRDNSWACASGVIGSTYKEQQDKKIDFIEKNYNKRQQAFTILETISFDDITNSSDIQYMYNQSSIYQKLVSDLNNAYIDYSDSFYKNANTDVDYQRLVFNVENHTAFILDIDFELDKGEVSIWLISSDGEIIYQSDTASKCINQIIFDDMSGLYSVILVNHYNEEFEMSGRLNLQIHTDIDK